MEIMNEVTIDDSFLDNVLYTKGCYVVRFDHPETKTSGLALIFQCDDGQKVSIPLTLEAANNISAMISMTILKQFKNETPLN